MYAIATEDDIIATISEMDLLHSVSFLRDTIRAMGTEDVAEYLRHMEGRADVTDDDVIALADRLDRFATEIA
jgi:hypothetical protein